MILSKRNLFEVLKDLPDEAKIDLSFTDFLIRDVETNVVYTGNEDVAFVNSEGKLLPRYHCLFGKHAEKECKIESDGSDVFVVFEGKRIAKRGRPGTSQAKKWVSLERGYNVCDEGDLEAVVVEHDGVRQRLSPSDN
jgi:hypothetical protein